MTQRIKRQVAIRRYVGDHRAATTGALDRITDFLARFFNIVTQEAA